MEMLHLVEKYKRAIMDAFYHLHQHPEISWEEFNTTAFIKDILEKQRIRVRIFTNSTGVIE